MELTLLGTVAVAAFIVIGGLLLLAMTFRRTIALRAALLSAVRRIEQLEAQIAAISDGKAIVLAPRAEAQAADTAPAAPPIAVTAPIERFATLDEISAQNDGKVEPPPVAVIGGVALLSAVAALAGARYQALAADAGVGVAMVMGALLVGAAEWRRSADAAREAPPSPWPSRAAIAALAGFAIMLGALVYGLTSLSAPSPQIAFLGAAILSLAAAAFSLRLGPWLVGFALICGALTPALATLDSIGPLARYGFLIVLATSIAVLARQIRAVFWAWIAAAIALGWGAWGLAEGAEHLAATASYLAALSMLGLLYAWSEAETALPYPRFWRGGAWNEAMAVGHALALAAGACLLALIYTRAPPLEQAGASIVALAALATGASALRPALWLASFGAAVLAALAVGLWPAPAGAAIEADTLVLLAAALGLVFSLGGWIAMARQRDPRPGAALAALGPVAMFAAAHERVQGFGAPGLWAAIAVSISVLNTLAYLQLARTQREAAMPFAAGAALAFAGALYAATPDPYAPLGLALALPLIGVGDRLWNERGLRLGALILCGLICARLIIPQVFIATASPPPLLASLFLPALAACALASWLFARGRRRVRSAAALAPQAIALVLLGCLATFAARHAFTGGAIGAPYASLIEFGLNTLVWAAIATLLAARFGPRPNGFIATIEALAFAGAAGHAIIVGGIFLNPWWGLAAAEVIGARGFNAITLAYVAPAVLFFCYALLRARQHLEGRAAAALIVALLLVFVGVTLELRRLFHGAAMATAPTLYVEAWTYSAGWLGFAALLLALSTLRGERMLAYASLGLALAAIVKTALFDLGGVDGASRYLLAALLLAAGGALVYFYRRFVLPPSAARPKTMPDPNLSPPI